MIIVHIVEAWKGGIASYVQSLIKKQSSEGNEVYLLADEKQYMSDLRSIDAKLIYYSSSRNPMGFMRVAKVLSKEIVTINPDVIHCHSTFPGVYCRLMKSVFSEKIIYTPHGWSFFKKDIGVIKRTIFSFIEKKLSNRCKKVMCMSLEEIEAAKKIGIEEKKLTMIHTGIFDIPVNIEKLKFDPKKIKIGFFGRFDYQKGYDYLEAAVPFLSDNIELHFFGAPVRSEEKEIIAKNVINHGWVKYTDLHQEMMEMNAIIAPSRWEGFSLTLLEGMRAGRAVLVSGFSSLPEVVVHGYNGLVLYDLSPEGLASSMNNLSFSECVEMGRNSRKIFEQCYTFDSYYEKIKKLYLE